MELKINKELEEIIPRLSGEEYQALKLSIERIGQLVPINVMSDGTVVDGHHRYKACKELKKEPLFAIMPNVKTIEQALDYSFEINFPRRNINTFQKGEWAYRVKYLGESKRAGSRLAVRTKDFTSAKLAEVKGEAAKKVADMVGISRFTFDKVKLILEEASEDIKTKCREGVLSISGTYDVLIATESISEEYKEAKENLLTAYADGSLTSKNICEIVSNTNDVKYLLEGEDEKLTKSAEEIFSKDYYTEVFKSKAKEKECIWHIEELAGDSHALSKGLKSFDEIGSTKEEAREFFQQYSGRLIGEAKAWEGEWDRLAEKIAKLKEKLEEEEMRK